MSQLYLIPTLLAEDTLDTVSPQVRQVISQTDYYLVENLRTARRFISSLQLGKVIDQLTFFELNKDTSWEQVKDYFKQIPPQAKVGLMSEAGCPAIADPGHLAVRHAHQLGWEVIPLVGASSIILALMASGFNGQSFTFHGYLPIDKQERSKYIKTLERESKQKGQTQIFIETPYRNGAMLESLLKELSEESRLCVAADLTGKEALVKSMTVKLWKKEKIELHKRPAIFLILA